MEVNQQINLQFLGIGFPSVTFLSKQIFTQSVHGNSTINSNVQPRVYFPAHDKQAFSIVMDVKISCEGVFEIILLAIGNFRFQSEVEEDVKKNFVNVNAPAILFPYIRAFVSTFTSTLGYVLPSILLPPQFFKGDLEELTLQEATKNMPTSPAI